MNSPLTLSYKGFNIREANLQTSFSLIFRNGGKYWMQLNLWDKLHSVVVLKTCIGDSAKDIFQDVV